MIYLLKVSAILAIFYGIYYLFLQKETFFGANRLFLIVGLIASFVLPVFVIPDYVEVAPINFTLEHSIPIKSGLSTSKISDTPSLAKSEAEPIDYSYFISLVYFSGVVLFLFKLITSFMSLRRVFYNSESSRKNGLIHHETKANIAPFSFFNHIVYNPSEFSSQELNQVINHENIHVKQHHSVDVLFAQLVQIVLWFNPLAWLYKKAIQQNLEFIADRVADDSIKDKIIYQELLLRSSISSNQLKLVNSFYTSLIKKRIVMLHKTKSKPVQMLKLLVILPFLLLFLMGFNRETVFVPIKNVDSSFSLEQSQQKNDVEVLFNKDMTDENLEQIKNMLLEQGIKFKYSRIKRNGKGEIIRLKFEFEKDGKKTNYNINGDEPIDAFYFKRTDKGFEVSPVDKSKSEAQISKSAAGNNTYVSLNNAENDDDNNTKNAGEIDKDYVYNKWKKYSYSVSDSTNHDMIAIQNNNSMNFRTDYANPLVILNGIETDFSVLRLMNPKAIESVTVIKDKNATNIYGAKGENGVLVLVTKDGRFNPDHYPNGEDISIYRDMNGKVKVSGKDADKVIFIYDGKVVDKSELNKIDKSNIKSVEVLKGVEAVERYGLKASSGAVIILSNPKGSWSKVMPQVISEHETDDYTNMDAKTKFNPKALYIINETKSSYKEFLKINHTDIKNLTLIEPSEAKEDYGIGGKNGVYLIETKSWSPDIEEREIERNRLESQGYTYQLSSGKQYNHHDGTSSIEFILNSNSTDEFIERQVKALEKHGITAKVNRVRRNKAGKIKGLKVILLDENGKKSSASWKSNDRLIPNIVMGKSSDGELILRALK